MKQVKLSAVKKDQVETYWIEEAVYFCEGQYRQIMRNMARMQNYEIRNSYYTDRGEAIFNNYIPATHSEESLRNFYYTGRGETSTSNATYYYSEGGQ